MVKNRIVDQPRSAKESFLLTSFYLRKRIFIKVKIYPGRNNVTYRWLVFTFLMIACIKVFSLSLEITFWLENLDRNLKHSISKFQCLENNVYYMIFFPALSNFSINIYLFLYHKKLRPIGLRQNSHKFSSAFWDIAIWSTLKFCLSPEIRKS